MRKQSMFAQIIPIWNYKNKFYIHKKSQFSMDLQTLMNLQTHVYIIVNETNYCIIHYHVTSKRGHDVTKFFIIWMVFCLKWNANESYCMHPKKREYLGYTTGRIWNYNKPYGGLQQVLQLFCGLLLAQIP